jgi:DNA end-binding protein Ku
MASRAIWKGSIAFGLVQIPVELHVAEEPDELSFRQLDKHDFSPIGYDRINKRTGKKVAWEDIVRGFEVEKDEYVVLSDEELESANVEATHTIDIVAFVDEGEVDPIFFEKPYYVTPTKQGAKAYALLRATLAKNKQVGIAQIVIRTRQHLAALMPNGEALTLVRLRYAHELRSADDLALPDKSLDKLGVSDAEARMADMLVRGMHDKWKPEQYKDTYRDDILALVDKKAKAGEVNTIAELPHERHEAKQKSNVVDLMDMLKRSLGEKGIPAPASNGHHAKRPGVKKASGNHHRKTRRKSA